MNDLIEAMVGNLFLGKEFVFAGKEFICIGQTKQLIFVQWGRDDDIYRVLFTGIA